MSKNKEGLVTARISSQIIPQNQFIKHTVLPLHWPCDSLACTAITLALKAGHYCCSGALLPLETQPHKLSRHRLLPCIVCGPSLCRSLAPDLKLSLERLGINISAFASLHPSPRDSQINEFSKYKRGSNVGQPRKDTKYPLYKQKREQFIWIATTESKTRKWNAEGRRELQFADLNMIINLSQNKIKNKITVLESMEFPAVTRI